MTRPTRLLAAVLAAGLVLGACAKEEGESEQVREFIDATTVLPHRFVYTETTPDGSELVVQGIVEDDFRYKARVVVDGEPELDRVVSDDTAAVRFLAPEALGRYIDKDVVEFVDTATDIDGIDVYTALQAGRWVADPGGAPPILRSVDDQTDSGVDPIFDAMQMLAVVRQITLAEDVVQFVKYSENSISPVYRTDEDPFPRPEEGADVVRYDLPQGSFPDSPSGGQQILLPQEYMFQKLSVYVRDGRIVRISQQVGLAPSVLDNFETYMVQLINQTAPGDVAAGFNATVERLEGDELGAFLLDSANTLRDLQGDPPIRFRTATYELLDLGDDSLAVDLPTEDVITADLAVLVNLGLKPIVPEDEDDDAEGSGDAGTGADAVDGADAGADAGAEDGSSESEGDS